jgi:hypothetical protein
VTHVDPRRRRRELAPPVDALAAAVRLDQAVADMRARAIAGGPALAEDEPPTGLLDLAAIRAALGDYDGEVDPAAAAWLAGGPDPAAARVLEQVDHLGEPVAVRAWIDETTPGAPLKIEPVFEPPRPGPEDITYAPDVAEALDLDATQVHTEPEPVPSPEPVPVEPEAVAPPSPPAPARVFSSEHEPRPGWSSRHDPRSLAYGIRARRGIAPLQDVDLPLGPVLDQGQEGECVGCGTVDATNVLRRLAGRSDMLKIDAAAALYRRAQQLDDVPGTDYSGTSVLAGMQAGVEAGYFTEYLWAFGTRDIATALGHQRPVVVGVPWLSGMYDTGPGGVVRVEGDDRGEGHCLVIAKLRMQGPHGEPGPWFGWLNSWGRSYGDNGVGWIHHRDLADLLHGTGEAAVPS